MEVICPSCGETLEVPVGMAEGRHLQCSICGSRFCIRGVLAEPIACVNHPRAVPVDEPLEQSEPQLFYKLSGEFEWRNYAWRRWTARMIDFYCGYVISIAIFYGLAYASVATGVGLGFWSWITEPGHVWIDYVLTTTFSYYVSVVVYAMFGTTLGKKMCGLLVSDSLGRRMCAWDYFVREVRVMFFGEWLCVPLLSAIGLCHQYHMVTNAGHASYDANWRKEDCYSRPIRGKSTWDGWLIALVVVCGAILRKLL